MPVSTKLAISYAICALIATVANISAQDIFIRSYSGAYNILTSVMVGTVVGLVVKYILDKRYIFGFQATGVAHDTKTFALYTVMGLVTTCIFWGFEFAFYYVFENKEMRYLGGAIGLTVGYITKYNLDKHFVFKHSSSLKKI